MPLGPAARAIAGVATTGTSSPSCGSCGRRIESAALLTTKWKARPSARDAVRAEPAGERSAEAQRSRRRVVHRERRLRRCGGRRRTPRSSGTRAGARRSARRGPRAAGGRSRVSCRRRARRAASGVKSPRRFSTIAVSPTWSPVIVNGSVSVVAAAGRRMPRSDGVLAGCSRRPSSAGDCDEKSARQPSIDASERAGSASSVKSRPWLPRHVARLAHHLRRVVARSAAAPAGS